MQLLELLQLEGLRRRQRDGRGGSQRTEQGEQLVHTVLQLLVFGQQPSGQCGLLLLLLHCA